LLGPESRDLAGGYRLKRVDGANGFALIIPHATGGQIVDEIGWRKPLIIARATGSTYWDVIDTDHAEHSRMSDEELRANPAYKSISTMSAQRAWNTLQPGKRLW
jgi:UDP-N-acetylglucosamine transferase subunit ALG13